MRAWWRYGITISSYRLWTNNVLHPSVSFPVENNKQQNQTQHTHTHTENIAISKQGYLVILFSEPLAHTRVNWRSHAADCSGPALPRIFQLQSIQVPRVEQQPLSRTNEISSDTVGIWRMHSPKKLGYTRNKWKSALLFFFSRFCIKIAKVAKTKFDPPGCLLFDRPQMWSITGVHNI